VRLPPLGCISLLGTKPILQVAKAVTLQWILQNDSLLHSVPSFSAMNDDGVSPWPNRRSGGKFRACSRLIVAEDESPNLDAFARKGSLWHMSMPEGCVGTICSIKGQFLRRDPWVRQSIEMLTSSWNLGVGIVRLENKNLVRLLVANVVPAVLGAVHYVVRLAYVVASDVVGGEQVTLVDKTAVRDRQGLVVDAVVNRAPDTAGPLTMLARVVLTR
jgi:hypothetical protein